jgi:hypothetical protein
MADAFELTRRQLQAHCAHPRLEGPLPVPDGWHVMFDDYRCLDCGLHQSTPQMTWHGTMPRFKFGRTALPEGLR